MAIELRISVELVDTEPEVAGNPGVIIRSTRDSSMAFEFDGKVSDAFVLAGARLDSLSEEVLTDVKGQLEIAGKNAELEE